MKRSTEQTLLVITGGTAILGLLVLCILAGIRDCRWERHCEAGGGHVEKYDCSTTYVPMSCGSNCTYLSPVENCSYKCVGAKAEMP